MGFSLCHLGHTQGVGLGVAVGSNIFSNHGHVAYLIKGNGEQNRIQVKFSPYGQTCELKMESRGQLSLNFFESWGCSTPSTAQLRVLTFSKMFQNSEIVVQLLI